MRQKKAPREWRSILTRGMRHKRMPLNFIHFFLFASFIANISPKDPLQGWFLVY
jgi:hypothetical protein